MHRLCDKNPIIIIFLVFIQGFLANSVDPDQPCNQDPTVYHAAYVMLHGMVTCFHMLKIANMFFGITKSTKP